MELNRNKLIDNPYSVIDKNEERRYGKSKERVMGDDTYSP